MKRLRMLLLLLLLVPVAAEEREDERNRLVFLSKVETKAEPVVEIVEKGSAEKALAVYEQVKGNLDADAMARIYKAAGEGIKAFKNVAFLIGEEKISAEHSIAMARMREAMIEKLIIEIGKEKGWRIARSDSGNVNSGMKSDLDQTFYVFEGEAGEDGWEFKRKPELDGEFIRMFNERWAKRHAHLGVSVKALDVASIEGRNRFPDARVVETDGFWSENQRTHQALRNTPGAYTYGGAVGHQMQFRALAAILAGNVRAYQVYEPSDPSRADSEWRQNTADADEAIRTMFGKRPELRPVWAFDAALANFLDLQGYMSEQKFETKYHLRTFEDSILSKWLADQGHSHTAKRELIDLNQKTRNRFYDAILPRMFPGDSPEMQRKRKLHRLALEISVAQRLQHKDAHGKVAAFRGNPPSDPEAQRRMIFDEFARERFGEQWTSGAMDAEILGAVDREYRSMASEFCLESAYNTSREAFAVLLDQKSNRHLDLDRYRALLDIESDAEWARTQENLRQAAHLTFLYGIYDLGLAKSTELANRLRQEFGNRYAFDLLWLWTRGRVQGVVGEISYKGLDGIYREFLERRVNPVVDPIVNRVRDHVLQELGYEHRAAIDAVDAKLKQHHLVWNPKRFVQNIAYDPGNIDAVAQVVRVFVESKGDWEKTGQAIAQEFLMAIPVVGQVVGVARGGVTGLVAMGAAMAYPPIGGVMVAIGVGQAGYAIYAVEVATPARANAVNAVYRGFSGPELASFDDVPPQFTDEDAALIDELEERIRKATPRTSNIRVYDAESARKVRELLEAQLEELRKLKAELEPQIRGLKHKKQAWESYRDDPTYGGYFTGAGARTVQEPFRNFLLKDLELFISFSPGGLVDFRAKQDEAEIERLARKAENAASFREVLEAEAAHNEALMQKEREDRARRFLERANGKAANDDAVTPRERRMGLRELRFKLLRDSLYPALKAKGFDDPDKFVDAFFADNQAVLDELLRHKLVPADSNPIYIAYDPAPIVQYTRLSKFPEQHMAQLKAAVRADFERSRILWEHFLEREKIRNLKAQQDLARRIEAFEAAAAGEAVSRMRANAQLKALYAAMREGVPIPSVPRMEATVYRKDAETGWAVETRVRADPTVFRPPYRSRLWGLSPDDVKRAIASKSHKGMPLYPTTVQSLRSALSNVRPSRSDKDDRLFFLVDVTCERVDARLVEGVPEHEGRSVIGQYVSWGREKPEEQTPPPPPTKKRIWYFYDFAGHPADDARVFQRLGEHFPELRGIKPDWRHTPTDRVPPVLSVRPSYFELDRVKRSVERARGGRSMNFAKMRGTWLHGMCYTKLTCGGRTRHAYFIYKMFGGDMLGNASFPGLKDGAHAVKAECRLPNGDRFTDSYRIVVKRKPNDGKKLEKAIRSLGFSRERTARDRSAQSQASVEASLRAYIRAYIEQGEGKPAEIDKCLAELAEIAPPLIQERGRTARPGQFLHTYPGRLGDYTQLCRMANSAQAYKTLLAVTRAVEPYIKVTGRSVPYQLWSAHETLASLSVATTGKLGQAAKHLDDADQWRKRAGQEPKPRDWWPTKHFR